MNANGKGVAEPQPQLYLVPILCLSACSKQPLFVYNSNCHKMLKKIGLFKTSAKNETKKQLNVLLVQVTLFLSQDY